MKDWRSWRSHGSGHIGNSTMKFGESLRGTARSVKICIESPDQSSENAALFIKI